MRPASCYLSIWLWLKKGFQEVPPAFFSRNSSQLQRSYSSWSGLVFFNYYYSLRYLEREAALSSWSVLLTRMGASLCYSNTSIVRTSCKLWFLSSLLSFSSCFVCSFSCWLWAEISFWAWIRSLYVSALTPNYKMEGKRGRDHSVRSWHTNSRQLSHSKERLQNFCSFQKAPQHSPKHFVITRRYRSCSCQTEQLYFCRATMFPSMSPNLYL